MKGEKIDSKERKVEKSKREQSDTTTTMRMKHGCDEMSADPNLSHACACDSVRKYDVRCGVHSLESQHNQFASSGFHKFWA